MSMYEMKGTRKIALHHEKILAIELYEKNEVRALVGSVWVSLGIYENESEARRHYVELVNQWKKDIRSYVF